MKFRTFLLTALIPLIPLAGCNKQPTDSAETPPENVLYKELFNPVDMDGALQRRS